MKKRLTILIGAIALTALLPVLSARRLGAVRALADVVLAPEIRTSAQLRLGSRGWLVEAGEAAAQARIGEIRRLFAEPAARLRPWWPVSA